MKNWLNKYSDAPDAQNGIEGTMGGLTDQGFNYNGAWGGTMQMGGSLPGSVGFMYARTQSPAPSNGKYAKKTKASAQNGMEMKYWQEGLDWRPKTISKNGGWLSKYDDLSEAQGGTAVTKLTGDQSFNNADKMYAPIYDKLEKIYGERKVFNNPQISNSANSLIDKMLGYSFSDFEDKNPDRKIPPMDPILKEMQTKLLALPPDEIKRLAGSDWSSMNIFKALKMRPSNVSIPQVWKYKSHIDDLLKQGYTFEDGGIIEDDMGQWAHPGEITKVNSNQITMQGVDYPVLGISDTGDTKLMQPGQDYSFDGSSVTEYPMAQNGITRDGYGDPDYVTGTSRRAFNKMVGMGNYLVPANALNRAADLAKAKGLDYGATTSGPADAVRHAAAAASVASRLPVPEFIGQYSPDLDRAIRIAGANILGIGNEIMSPNSEGLWMDIKNNYQGSLIGSIPGLNEEARNKMIVNQLQKGKLTVDNPKKTKKQNGGWLNKYE